MACTQILLILFTTALGQKCISPSGGEGFCREKDDCFGSSHKSNCQNNFHCCLDSGKAVKKCREYGKYVYRQEYGSGLTARVQLHNVSECNIEGVPLVVGGVMAKRKEFPHMAAIGYGNDLKNVLWLCGGSLISERFVLSAAHCVESPERGVATFVRFKALNITTNDPNVLDLKIAERFIHPRYKPNSRYNDIALFKLSDSVQIDGYARPACLHTTFDEKEHKNVVATGWGKLDYNDDKGSDMLMKVTLSILDSWKCNSTYPAEFGFERGIINSQLCVGEIQGGKDTCLGDSGGPVQIVRKEPYCMYGIVGITSFGKFCGFKNSPAIYTRVAHFVPWIESIVWP